MVHLHERGYWYSVASGSLLCLAGLVAVFEAIRYATVSASNSVTDIILSNTRVWDVDGIFVYGGLGMVLLIALVLAFHSRRLPFSLKALGVFYLARAISVSLTHLSPYPNHVAITQSLITSSRFLQVFFTGDDLFFSGHTGLPFLISLIFWDIPILRYAFLALSGVFAMVVLLGHLHYSIDVFAAYFITYGVFMFTQYAFEKDYGAVAHDA